jgi:hypothetical protein
MEQEQAFGKYQGWAQKLNNGYFPINNKYKAWIEASFTGAQSLAI